MKVYRNNKHVKTIPADFAPVISSYTFKSDKKRLSYEERYELGLLLSVLRFEEYLKNGSGVQFEYLRKRFTGNIEAAFLVEKQDGSKYYEINFNNTTCIVPSSALHYYPEVKHIRRW